MAEGEARYCTTSDGVRIAYRVQGDGAPLIALPHFVESFSVSHHMPEYQALAAVVAQHNRLIQFDWRGTGLSQRNIEGYSLASMCLDVEAVASALRLRRFALWAPGPTTPVVLRYAAVHARQIARLVAYGSYRRISDIMSSDAMRAYTTLWRTNPDVAAQTLADLSGRERYAVEGAQLARMYRESISGENGAMLLEAIAQPEWDAEPYLAGIAAPTLVMHRRNDGIIPFAAGQAVAAGIQNARFLPLAGENNFPFVGDSAAVLDAMLSFLAEEQRKPRARRTETPASGVTTILFTDLVAHTEMMRRLGDDRGREVLREHERITRETLNAHGGTEVKTMGDGSMASFASVTKAMDCAIALQRAFAAHEGERLQVRVGLNAGEPIEEDGDLFGSTVIMASRIAAQAGAGEILIPEPLRHLLTGKSYVYADRGETMLKGFEDAVRLYEVRWRE